MVELVEAELREFEAALSSELRSEVAFIQAIGDDLVSAGGKRLRPTLAYLASSMLGGSREDATTVGLAVELLHSASLLHDDLIDDSATRRGTQTAFIRYGNVVSVMSGDFMLARVLGLLAKAGNLEFITLMSRAAAALCEGEVLQFQVATLQDWSFDTYRRVIEGKTAELFAAATEGVGMLAGATAVQRNGLREFGLAYGRAFQMRDDHLDLLGDSSALGKPTGGDLREGKATHAVLQLILLHDSEEARTIVGRHASVDGDVERMARLVRESGADEVSKAAIAKECRNAESALSVFSASPAREALVSLVRAEAERVA